MHAFAALPILRSSLRFLVFSILAVTALAPARALAEPVKCERAIAKENAKLTALRAGALAKCEEQRLKGDLTVACPDPATATLRECNPDNGVLGGSVSATGAANPPTLGVFHPTLGALFCLRPASNFAINAGIGLPGPRRLQMPMTATFSSDG